MKRKTVWNSLWVILFSVKTKVIFSYIAFSLSYRLLGITGLTWSTRSSTMTKQPCWHFDNFIENTLFCRSNGYTIIINITLLYLVPVLLVISLSARTVLLAFNTLLTASTKVSPIYNKQKQNGVWLCFYKVFRYLVIHGEYIQTHFKDFVMIL